MAQSPIVMITPPQDGSSAAQNVPRGKLTDHMHVIYRNILTEYYTDGHSYVSADGKKRYAADQYHQQIAADIQAGAKKLPLTVSGEVAWVCAQTSPKHLRLTLVDGGYLNPSDKTAEVTFNTIDPVRVTDVLSGETIAPLDEGAASVEIPCGLFRFIDVELEEPLN